MKLRKVWGLEFIFKILFVCSGNTCRSPMAEYIFRDYLAKNRIYNIFCNSAGLFASKSQKASKNAVEALLDININLNRHLSKNINEIDINNYDLIVTMSKNHASALLALGVSKSEIYILNEKNGGILDPFGRELNIYIKTRNEILESLKLLFRSIQKNTKKYKIVSASELYMNETFEIEKESFSDPWSLENLKSELFNKNSIFLVAASEENEVLAYVLSKLNFESADLVKIAVHKNFRMLGIAKALIKEIELKFKNLGVKSILLEVRRSNTIATYLYKSLNFKPVCVRKDFYSFPKEDAILMILEINS